MNKQIMVLFLCALLSVWHASAMQNIPLKKRRIEQSAPSQSHTLLLPMQIECSCAHTIGFCEQQAAFMLLAAHLNRCPNVKSTHEQLKLLHEVTEMCTMMRKGDCTGIVSVATNHQISAFFERE